MCRNDNTLSVKKSELGGDCENSPLTSTGKFFLVFN